MTAKEKATDLIRKFKMMHYAAGGVGVTEKQAKECALICVQEIINTSDLEQVEFYNQVIKQINFY